MTGCAFLISMLRDWKNNFRMIVFFMSLGCGVETLGCFQGKAQCAVLCVLGMVVIMGNLIGEGDEGMWFVVVKEVGKKHRISF